MAVRDRKWLAVFIGPEEARWFTLPLMKKLFIPAFLVLVVGLLFTSCTSVPQDKPVPQNTSTTRTYSK